MHLKWLNQHIESFIIAHIHDLIEKEFLNIKHGDF